MAEIRIKKCDRCGRVCDRPQDEYVTPSETLKGVDLCYDCDLERIIVEAATREAFIEGTPVKEQLQKLVDLYEKAPAASSVEPSDGEPSGEVPPEVEGAVLKVVRLLARPISANDCRQRSVVMKKFSVEEVRGFFQSLSRSGKGRVKGEGRKMKFSL